MTERESLTPRVVEAIEGRLRRWLSPRMLRRVYRVGYLALRPWWFITRPHTIGMKAVVCRGEEVLLVRHTYARRNQWDIPGGYVRAGEEATVTLRRELKEELGIEPLTVVPIAEVASRFDRKRERIHVFSVEVVAGVELRPSEAEIATVCWARHDALPPDVTVFARRMIARSYWEMFR